MPSEVERPFLAGLAGVPVFCRLKCLSDQHLLFYFSTLWSPRGISLLWEYVQHLVGLGETPQPCLWSIGTLFQDRRQGVRT